MNKITRVIVWVLTNGTMLVCLWFGLSRGIDGAKNIGLFLVWFSIALSPAYLSERIMDDLVKNHGGGSVHPAVASASDATIAALLAWHGFMWTAGLYLAHMIMERGGIAAAQKRAKKETT